MSGDSRVPVCDADELEDGGRVIADLDGIEIGVFNVDGELFAIGNTCPHRNGPVCEGKVALVGEWPGIGQRLRESMTGDPPSPAPGTAGSSTSRPVATSATTRSVSPRSTSLSRTAPSTASGSRGSLSVDERRRRSERIGTAPAGT